MNQENDNKNKLKNDYVAGLIMLAFSACLVFVAYLIFYRLGSFEQEESFHSVCALGGGSAFLFQMGFYIVGGLDRPLSAVLKRWKTFFFDLQISFKMAFRSLIFNFKHDGIVFLWYMLISVSTFLVCIHGIMYFVTM